MQVAKHFGATVTGISSTSNVDLVRSLEPDHVVDYTAEDIAEASDRCELVLQVAGADRGARLRRLLTPDGTLIQLSGDCPNRWAGPLSRVLAGRPLSVFVGQTITSFTVQPNGDDLELLASLVDGGALRTNLDRTYSLDEVAQALEHVETARTRGKVAIAIASANAGRAIGHEREATAHR